MSKKSLVWLASYPKSGNTWLRAFIANMMQESDAPVPLDSLGKYVSNDVELSNYPREAAALNKSDQAIMYRAAGLDTYAASNPGGSARIMKTHLPFAGLGRYHYFPPEYTLASIYIVRDPRDVAMSMAPFLDVSLKEAADYLNSETTVLGGPKTGQLRIRLGTWAQHVGSWVTTRHSHPHLNLRYEDLLQDPEKYLGQVAKFLALPGDAAKIRRAIDASSFQALQDQEKESGFREHNHDRSLFFHAGQAGRGKAELPNAERHEIESRNQQAMRALGYM